MDPSRRIVTSLPLTDLWDERGDAFPSRHVRDLGEEDVRQLLRADPTIRVVIANVGSALRWIDQRETYRVWNEDLQPHLVDPTLDKYYLEDFPDDLAYLASEWLTVESGPVIVFEASH